MDEMSPADTHRLELYRPPADLARKRPASTVVASKRVTRGRKEIMSSADRWAVVGAAQRAAERGEIQFIRRQPVLNAETGRYEVIVRRLRDPRPRWVMPALIGGGALLLLATVTGIGLWAVHLTGSLAGAWLLMMGTTLLLIWLFRALSKPRGGRGAVDVDVQVRVRSR